MTRSLAGEAAAFDAVRERVLVVVWGMEGPKKREAELVLARRVIDVRGAVSGTFVCRKGCGPLLPVSRLRGTGEPLGDGGGTLWITDIRLRLTDGKATGGDFDARLCLGLDVSGCR